MLNIPNNAITQSAIILLLMIIYVSSVVSGVSKGIQLLSRINVIIAIGLTIFIVFFGKVGFIVDSYLQSFGLYISEFLSMSLYRGDSTWLSWWTVFRIRTFDGNFYSAYIKR